MPILALPADQVKAEVARLSALAIQHMAECDRLILEALALIKKDNSPTPEIDQLIDQSMWHFTEAVRVFAVGETLHKAATNGGWDE